MLRLGGLENSIFLTERDQSFMYTYRLIGDWSFENTFLVLEINILRNILAMKRVIFPINNLSIKRFFTKKDKWLWNISHNFAIFDINQCLIGLLKIIWIDLSLIIMTINSCNFAYVTVLVYIYLFFPYTYFSRIERFFTNTPFCSLIW